MHPSCGGKRDDKSREVNNNNDDTVKKSDCDDGDDCDTSQIGKQYNVKWVPLITNSIYN